MFGRRFGAAADSSGTLNGVAVVSRVRVTLTMDSYLQMWGRPNRSGCGDAA